MVVPAAVPATEAGDAAKAATASTLAEAHKRLVLVMCRSNQKGWAPKSPPLAPDAGTRLFHDASEADGSRGPRRDRTGESPANMGDVGRSRCARAAAGQRDAKRRERTPGPAAVDRVDCALALAAGKDD